MSSCSQCLSSCTKKANIATPPFEFEPLFQLQPATVNYQPVFLPDHILPPQQLNSDPQNRKVTVISGELLEFLAAEAFAHISFLYRSSHLQQLREIIDDPEASSNDKFVALDLLKNACIASKKILPMCQDTGTAIVIATKGENIFTGVSDVEWLSKGVYDCYTQKALRYSQNAPLSLFEEKNTRTNLPAQIDISTDHEHSNEYHFLFMAKGGGSANKTLFFQKTQALLNPQSLNEFLAEQLPLLGTAACPPYHLAVVIGGLSPELNLKTVKLASAHYLDTLPITGSPRGRAFRDITYEKELLKMCRKTGIGAQFGGKYFVLDTRVIRLPRHGASCPVGIGVSCSADRQTLAKVTSEGVFLEQLEENPAKFVPPPSICDSILSSVALPIDLTKNFTDILKQLNSLQVGARVMLSGPIIVARDMAHSRIVKSLEETGSLPPWLPGRVIYYAGPAKTPEGMPSGSFGPTTSGRMDSYLPILMPLGASLITLGKGNRSKLVKDCCAQYGGFYLASIGGPAALIAQDCIEKVQCIAYEEIGMEAVWQIEVKNFPAFIVVDNKGNDLYMQLKF